MVRSGLITASICLALSATNAETAEVLFPAPLHLTRAIDDPISKTRTIVEEYCSGNRVIAIRGAMTSIADYEKGELTQIDRNRGTYSITKFETIAKSQLADATVASTTSSLERKGTEMRAGRAAELFEARMSDGTSKRVIRVGVSREIAVSREALEVLIGARYPNRRGEEHAIAIDASTPQTSREIRASSALVRDYALPLEQSVDYEIDGATLQFRNIVTRIGHELPPADLITPPPGATLVESDIGKLQDRLRELDSLPQQKSNNR